MTFVRQLALLLVLSGAVAVTALAGDSQAPDARDAQSAPLTIDSPILDLLEDPRTKPVVERHLPKLSARLLEDSSAAELLGGSSPRELSVDSHVRGITEGILQRLQSDLLAAQRP